jgi:hypothetical protein
MIPHEDFPHLSEVNHRVTSPDTKTYNCIAWAANDTANWWQPGVYWPIPVEPEDSNLSTLERAFEFLRFKPCANADLEPGIEKVALYSLEKFYTHAARQLPNGKWTSKLGKAEDIEHDTPDDVAGGIYGDVARLMQRTSE